MVDVGFELKPDGVDLDVELGDAAGAGVDGLGVELKPDDELRGVDGADGLELNPEDELLEEPELNPDPELLLPENPLLDERLSPELPPPLRPPAITSIGITSAKHTNADIILFINILYILST